MGVTQADAAGAFRLGSDTNPPFSGCPAVTLSADERFHAALA